MPPPGFDFWGGEVVKLREDHPDYDLKAGDQGYVWGVYDLSPPLYEADFYGTDGRGCAMMFTPDEVELVKDPIDFRLPDDVLDSWRRRDEPDAPL